MGWLRRLWPKKMLSQMVVLIVLALILAQGISVWILSNAHRTALLDNSERHLVRQFASAVNLLEQTPAPLQHNILKAWKRPGQSYWLRPSVPKVFIDQDPSVAEQRLMQQLHSLLGDQYQGRVLVVLRLDQEGDRDAAWAEFGSSRRKFDDEVRKSRSPDRSSNHKRPSRLPLKQMVLAAQLDDERWFIGRIAAPDFTPLAARHTLTFVIVASALVLLVVFWQLRKITQPLSSLARAANDLGRGATVAPLKEQGPADVRETVIAFNRMNDRLQRFVADRTRMLAALSHDLRTPLTSMRLRVELMAASDERDRLLMSLDEMQQMSEATLSFVRQSGDTETTCKVDVGALIDSLCEDLRDVGMTLEWPQLPSVIMNVRPVSLKRALRNVIENAVKYAGAASVGVALDGEHLVISVVDSGPGIAEDKLESVFEPFVRVEQSRNRDTGGMGLGLSIAQQIVVSHGGQITLHNLNPGLKVQISLPL